MLTSLFWHVGLLPLAAVAVRGRALPAVWWWRGAAFAVSWVADLAGYFGQFLLVSQAYPLLQGGLFAFALAPKRVALPVIAGLAVVSGISLSWRMAAGFDLLLHVAAFGTTAVLAGVHLAPGVLRTTLVAGFGALAIAWVPSVLLPAWDEATWLVYGWIRVLTALGFLWAAWQATRSGAVGA